MKSKVEVGDFIIKEVGIYDRISGDVIKVTDDEIIIRGFYGNIYYIDINDEYEVVK